MFVSTAGPHIRRRTEPALAAPSEGDHLKTGYEKKSYFVAIKEKKYFKGKLHSFCSDR